MTINGQHYHYIRFVNSNYQFNDLLTVDNKQVCSFISSNCQNLILFCMQCKVTIKVIEKQWNYIFWFVLSTIHYSANY